MSDDNNEKAPGSKDPKGRGRTDRSRHIGSQLRRMYDDVILEDVPSDFLKLLEEADTKKTVGDC